MSPRPSSRNAGKRFGCAGLVLVVVLLAAFSGAMELFWTRVDQRRFPWAYAESGRPTSGAWSTGATAGGRCRAPGGSAAVG